MNLLLDTHAFLWFIAGDKQLGHFHKDPFDRMIISQAIAEKMVIITKDGFFKDYKVKVMW